MKKWTVQKEVLETAISILGNVPARNAVDCSEFIRIVRLDNLAVAALSSEMSVQVRMEGQDGWPFKEPIYLDRRLFEPFVSAGKDLPGKLYTFHQNDNGQMVVKHSIRQAVYARAKKASGYGDPPKYKKAKVLEMSDDLASAISMAAGCATSDPITPFLNCVYLKPYDSGIYCFATNGSSVVFRTSVRGESKSDIAFPLGLAKLCDGLDDVKLSWDDGSATLTNKTSKVWQPVKTEASKSFPVKSFQKMIAGFEKKICAVNLSSLGKAVDRLSSCLTAVTREDLVLTLRIVAGKDSIRLDAGVTKSMFTERFGLMQSSKRDYTLSWPLDEVLPVLSFMQRDKEGWLYQDDEGRTMLASKHSNLVVAKKEK